MGRMKGKNSKWQWDDMLVLFVILGVFFCLVMGFMPIKPAISYSYSPESEDWEVVEQWIEDDSEVVLLLHYKPTDGMHVKFGNDKTLELYYQGHPLLYSEYVEVQSPEFKIVKKND